MSVREQQRIEQRLREVADPIGFLVALFTHAPIAIAVWSADGTLRLTNQAFGDLFKVEPPAKYNVLRDEHAAKKGLLPVFERAFRGETVHVPAFHHDTGEPG